jgi:hypothetical protein
VLWWHKTEVPMDVVVAVMDFVLAFVQNNWWWFVILWLFWVLFCINAHYWARIKSGEKLSLEDDYDGVFWEVTTVVFLILLSCTVVIRALVWLFGMM